MATILRRTLATLSSSTPASTSTVASRTTTPQAVRARLAKFPSSPTISRRLTPAQERRFQAAFDRGDLKDNDGAEIVDEDEARSTWLKRHDEWRSRVRGHTQVLNVPLKQPQPGSTLSSQTTLTPFNTTDTPPASALAAHRIYLPNIQIRMMRNHTPVGEPYDPYIATFRIPNSMTKIDLRSYLFAVYGLEVTYIRTDNYIGEVKRIGPAGQNRRVSGSTKTYKRAVVGLREPFQYPDDTEELQAVISAVEHPSEDGSTYEQRVAAAERAKDGLEKRQDWLNTNFALDMQANGRKRSMMKMASGWRWRAGGSDNQVSLTGGGGVEPLG